MEIDVIGLILTRLLSYLNRVLRIGTLVIIDSIEEVFTQPKDILVEIQN